MPFLSIEQATQQFPGMRVESLRGIAKSGKLPGARKIGGRWFIHTETLLDYFKATANPTETTPTAGAKA